MSYGDSRIYKKVEIIGTSSESVEAAIQRAVDRAKDSLEKLSWFEVKDVIWHIDSDCKVSEYQLVLKISFELS